MELAHDDRGLAIGPVAADGQRRHFETSNTPRYRCALVAVLNQACLKVLLQVVPGEGTLVRQFLNTLTLTRFRVHRFDQDRQAIMRRRLRI